MAFWAPTTERRFALPPYGRRCDLDTVPHSRNHLLASLSPDDFALLRPHLRDVELAHKTVLGKTDEMLTRAYSPHSGAISLVMPRAGGEMIEVAMVDSLFGGSAAIDGRISMNDAIV